LGQEENMPASRFDFTTSRGERLAGLLDEPAQVRAYALFAHCFTCGKDVHAARRIAEGLTALGIGVLRFDCAGLRPLDSSKSKGRRPYSVSGYQLG
jgi:putative redox protein